MNQRTEVLQTNFKPSLSIVVYKSDNDNMQKEYYLESHEINEAGQLLAGKPLLQSTISDIAEFFYEEKKERSQISGFVPENILSYSPLTGGNYKLVWYRPAETRFIHFAKQLHLQSGKVSVPPMLYIVTGSDLFIYAMQSDTRPAEKTKIYRAPFHNVADDGEVCLGNAKVKKPVEKTFTNIMKYWEDLFWLSEFSHLNGASNPTKSDLGKLWGRLVKSKCRLKWSALADELKETKHKSLLNILK